MQASFSFISIRPVEGMETNKRLIQTDYVQLFLTDLWLGAGEKTANILVVTGPDQSGQHQR